MRLFRTLLARTKFWDRYVTRVMEEPSLRTRHDAFRGPRHFRKKFFYYDENRPWTDGFKGNNMPGEAKKPVLVQPIEEWSVFKGDRVEILVGKDKGKQGIVNCVIKERNWVYVEGLNCEQVIQKSIPGMPPSCTKTEKPLLVTDQVKLVDPSDEEVTDIDWRYTEEGEKVRVSERTGRIIPLPKGFYEVDNFVHPPTYVENDLKDTKENDVAEITFKPKLCTFEEDINQEMGIEETKPKTELYVY